MYMYLIAYFQVHTCTQVKKCKSMYLSTYFEVHALKYIFSSTSTQIHILKVHVEGHVPKYMFSSTIIYY